MLAPGADAFIEVGDLVGGGRGRGGTGREKEQTQEQGHSKRKSRHRGNSKKKGRRLACPKDRLTKKEGDQSQKNDGGEEVEELDHPEAVLGLAALLFEGMIFGGFGTPGLREGSARPEEVGEKKGDDRRGGVVGEPACEGGMERDGHKDRVGDGAGEGAESEEAIEALKIHGSGLPEERIEESIFWHNSRGVVYLPRA